MMFNRGNALFLASLLATSFGSNTFGLTWQNYAPNRDDRFYVGADRAFIGQDFDWSGVAFSNAAPVGTMISPSFFVSTAHYNPPAGSVLSFYEGNSLAGPVHNYTVSNQYWKFKTPDGGSSDLILIKLTTPLNPADHIATYSVPTFDPDLLTGREMYIYGKNNQVGINSIWYASAPLLGYDYSTVGGLGADEAMVINGDSSHPSFIVDYTHHLSLIGVHTSSGMDTAIGWAVPQINTILATYGEQVTQLTNPSPDPGPPLPPQGHNATLTWTGAGSDANWNTATNWSGGLTPGATDDLRIAGGLASGTNIKIQANRTVKSLTILSDANPWTLAGGNGETLTLASGNLTLLDGPAVEPNATLVANLNQAVTGAWENQSTTASLIVQGIISGPGGINKTGPGTTLINSPYAHTYQGPTIVQSGILSFSPQGTTGVTNNVLPDFSPVTIAAGATLQIGTLETIGSLSGDGTMTMAAGGSNQQLNLGGDNSSTTFGGGISGVAGGTSAVRKLGTGTFTITGNIQPGTLLANYYAVDGTMRVYNQGKLYANVAVLPGAVLEYDDTGSQRVDRLGPGSFATSIGGEMIVRGHADANTALSAAPGNNMKINFNQIGSPILTLIPGTGYEAWLSQWNGGATGLFSIGVGTVALIRGDNLGGTAGTRSRFTILSQDLNTMLVGGAGNNFPDVNSNDPALRALATPRVSILPRAYGDSNSAGWGTGFITYSLGSDTAQATTNPGIRLLMDSEYSTTIANGEAASDKTLTQNKKISTPLTGLDANTRINSLLLQNGGALAGNGTLFVHSGMILSTADDAHLSVSTLVVPKEPNCPTQISLITPLASNQLTIASTLVTAADSDGNSLVKTGAGTVTLSGNNAYVGTTYINAGVLRANDGAGLPTASGLVLSGGVLESTGTFSRLLGSGNGKVQWYNANNGGADGGFSAGDGDLAVQLNNNALTLTWGAPNFIPLNRALTFGSTTSRGQVSFLNGLDLGSDLSYCSSRTIYVADNPYSTLDRASLSGTITGGTSALTLHKTGPGTLVFSSGSYAIYAAATSVDQGTLVINSWLNGDQGGAGAITVHPGGTLAGNGIIERPTYIHGGVFSPGDGVGALSFYSNLDLSGTYRWELAALTDDAAETGGVDFDQAWLDNQHGLSGTDPVLDLHFLNGVAPQPSAFWGQSHTWTLVGGAATFNLQGGSITGYGNDGAGPDGRFAVAVSGDALLLTWSPIPEPATLSLLALGAMTLLSRRSPPKT